MNRNNFIFIQVIAASGTWLLSTLYAAAKYFIYGALLIFITKNSVYAACSQLPKSLSVNITGNYTDHETNPVGTPLGGWAVTTEDNYAVCQANNSDLLLSSFTNGQAQAGGQTVTVDGLTHKVFQTNVPGVGYIAEVSNRPSYYTSPGVLWNKAAWSRWVAADNFNKIGDGWGGVNRDIYYGYRIRVMLIKTGPMSTGTLSPITLGQGGQGYAADNYSAYKAPITTSGTMSIIVPTCSTDITRMDIVLSNVYINELSGAVGSTSKEKAENISIKCNIQTTMSVTLEGVQNSDSTTDGVLQLSHASNPGVAEGVGIQILMNNVPLKLNTKTTLPTVTDNARSIEIKARYYKTQPTVTAGDASATGTIDIIYE